MRRKLAIVADAAGAALVVGAIVATYLSGDEPPVPFIAGINLAIVAVCILRFWAGAPPFIGVCPMSGLAGEETCDVLRLRHTPDGLNFLLLSKTGAQGSAFSIH